MATPAMPESVTGGGRLSPAPGVAVTVGLAPEQLNLTAGGLSLLVIFTIQNAQVSYTRSFS